jgi:hypothetical protein
MLHRQRGGKLTLAGFPALLRSVGMVTFVYRHFRSGCERFARPTIFGPRIATKRRSHFSDNRSSPNPASGIAARKGRDAQRGSTRNAQEPGRFRR